MPKISVLMTVFNCEQYLSSSIESILSQSHSDFEFVIVNDGSTDSTSDILTEYAAADDRINVISNPKNMGLAQSLNRGLKIAQGEFIARMDADDVSLPGRLAVQLAFMEQNPEIGVLGTNITYIDVDGRPMNGGRPKDARPVSPNLIKWLLLWKTPIYHPTVLLRRSVLEQTGILYDPRYDPLEDRDVWIRLSEHTVIASLSQVTVKYRVVPTSLSRTGSEEHRASSQAITRRMLTSVLGRKKANEPLETLINIFSNHRLEPNRDFVAASDALLEVYKSFGDHSLSPTDRKQIQADVADRLVTVAQEARRSSSKTAFAIMWKLRYLPYAHLFSDRTFLRIIRVILNSVRFHNPARLKSYPRAGIDSRDG